MACRPLARTWNSDCIRSAAILYCATLRALRLRRNKSGDHIAWICTHTGRGPEETSRRPCRGARCLRATGGWATRPHGEDEPRTGHGSAGVREDPNALGRAVRPRTPGHLVHKAGIPSTPADASTSRSRVCDMAERLRCGMTRRGGRDPDGAPTHAGGGLPVLAPAEFEVCGAASPSRSALRAGRAAERTSMSAVPARSMPEPALLRRGVRTRCAGGTGSVRSSSIAGALVIAASGRRPSSGSPWGRRRYRSERGVHRGRPAADGSGFTALYKGRLHLYIKRGVGVVGRNGRRYTDGAGPGRPPLGALDTVDRTAARGRGRRALSVWDPEPYRSRPWAGRRRWWTVPVDRFRVPPGEHRVDAVTSARAGWSAPGRSAVPGTCGSAGPSGLYPWPGRVRERGDTVVWAPVRSGGYKRRGAIDAPGTRCPREGCTRGATQEGGGCREEGRGSRPRGSGGTTVPVSGFRRGRRTPGIRARTRRCAGCR